MMVDALLSSAKSNGGTANRSQVDVSAHNYEEGKSSDQAQSDPTPTEPLSHTTTTFSTNEPTKERGEKRVHSKTKTFSKNRNKNPSLKMNHARYRRWISHTVDAPSSQTAPSKCQCIEGFKFRH